MAKAKEKVWTSGALGKFTMLTQNVAFIVLTDSETWYGSIHPMEALRRYRAESGLQAKLIVVGMTSSGFTIADPNDEGSLDCVGFDASLPQVIGDFVRGDSPARPALQAKP